MEWRDREREREWKRTDACRNSIYICEKRANVWKLCFCRVCLLFLCCREWVSWGFSMKTTRVYMLKFYITQAHTYSGTFNFEFISVFGSIFRTLQVNISSRLFVYVLAPLYCWKSVFNFCITLHSLRLYSWRNPNALSRHHRELSF